ncbi:hypothetical protein [Bradyrhizobium sp. USDA 10063]
MPYHVYARHGSGAFGVIVETARQALEKAAQFAEEGHPDVAFKDLLGNILDRAALIALAGDEEP